MGKVWLCIAWTLGKILKRASRLLEGMLGQWGLFSCMEWHACLSIFSFHSRYKTLDAWLYYGSLCAKFWGFGIRGRRYSYDTRQYPHPPLQRHDKYKGPIVNKSSVRMNSKSLWSLVSLPPPSLAFVPVKVIAFLWNVNRHFSVFSQLASRSIQYETGLPSAVTFMPKPWLPSWKMCISAGTPAANNAWK